MKKRTKRALKGAAKGFFIGAGFIVLLILFAVALDATITAVTKSFGYVGRNIFEGVAMVTIFGTVGALVGFLREDQK